ncbi:hypothetical protein ASE06_02945 [Sphingopyxis sp. Root214]|uniref:hypothetical protein n=1 Tax=unclassified Sphingopyxis TaxID=2614943 RepID=UPI0006FB6031|nr:MULTISPECIES: hypothetical protein [unclassified Sphingopyxis]KQZ77214.1 hypothetical protein ASD73_05045 [Sphingopyxis sp. Root154]KRC08899.1 hypothetical protein ASE06_02945 [Sphingopyxis sp. Root214]
MYAFVDRRVDSLCNSGRFLLWAMRGWVHAADRGRCPPQVLHRGFSAVDAAPALPDFHVAMALLAGDAVETLLLAPLPCLQISEDEAILLGLWRDFSLENAANAHATLAFLAEGESVGPIAKAMGAAVDRLVAAGFDMPDLAAGTMTHQESSKR